MSSLTPEATVRLERYLRDVRAALLNAPDLNADEIEADIRDHVATELHQRNPATIADLEKVLAQLGPPAAWAPGTNRVPNGTVVTIDPLAPYRWARGQLRSMFRTLARGPEDWRLAYITFLLFWVGLITTPIVIGVPLLIASYFFARAACSYAREQNVTLGARKWLIYPPIVMVSLPLFLALIILPFMSAPATMSIIWPTERFNATVASVEPDGTVTLRESSDVIRRSGNLSHEFHSMGITQNARKQWVIDPDTHDWHNRVNAAQKRLPMGSLPKQSWSVPLIIFVALGAFLLWWSICGVLFWAFPTWMTTLFFPLFEGYDYLHGVRVAVVFGVGFGIWAGYATRIFGVMM